MKNCGSLQGKCSPERSGNKRNDKREWEEKERGKVPDKALWKEEEERDIHIKRVRAKSLGLMAHKREREGGKGGQRPTRQQQQ